MILLHTSDWHLGHTWCGQSRRGEFLSFFDWVIETVQNHKVDVLLIAGDIFDTATPTAETQSDYFNFLERISNTGCQTVIVAGNHDSPQLLDAPAQLLSRINVTVHGIPTNAEDELITIKNNLGEPTILIGAVPFLRDADIRQFELDESINDRESRTLDGIKKHYANLCQNAEQLREGKDIPLVVTGHLFAAGGKTSEGVRDIHVGRLGRVGLDVFPDEIDYLALGHLHIPQKINNKENRRYSGSPLIMSFDESNQNKSAVLIKFKGRNPEIEILNIPQKIFAAKIEGNLNEIENAINNLPKNTEAFVEIIYTDTTPIPNLIQSVDNLLTNLENKKQINITRIKNENNTSQTILKNNQTESLEKIKPLEIFKRLLDTKKITDNYIKENEELLIKNYLEIEEEILQENKGK
ncbi:MAG: exonuclease SbcCD subunit D C-terminal domain-containing protein [Planctomycetaceae bacterium]|jgi:exonuclease SbcD|nr:exonuclease SbcCD subunit D C-terminal domain-containing protein [Planctomycetaceae bacterium]